MALTQTQVSKLYVSIFNRASEGSGNTYWQSGADLATVATQMLATPDAATYFGSSLNTNQAFVEHIYLNTLNKTVAQDAAGIAYWVAKLDAGTSRGQVVADLVTAVGDYATSTDPVTLAAYNQFHNRVVVSNYMADTVSAAPSDYATSTSFSSGLTVTSNAATVTTAQASIDGMNTGSAFTLTSADDTFLGTTASDTFTTTEANIEGDADILVDSSTADHDVLNITGTAFSATIDTTGATIRGIENVNVTFDSLAASTFDARGITTASTITVNQARAGSGATITVDRVATGSTVKAGTDVNNLTVTTSVADKSVTVDAQAATGTVSSTVSGTGTVSVTANSATSVTAVSATTTTVNAAAATTIAVTGKTTTVNSGAEATITATGTAATTDTLTISAGDDVTIANQAVNYETINVSGNGAAVVATITTTAATTYNITGSQNVTLAGSSALFTTQTVADGSSATSTLKLTTVATADLSKAAVDSINVAAAAGGAATLSVNNNANVELSENVVAAGLTLDLDEDAASTYTNGTLNLTLSKDITAGTVTIDNYTAGSDDGFGTVAMTVTAAQTSLDFAAGSAAVTISGSKAVVLDNTSTAASVNASAMTAALTAEANATLLDITSGAAADTITITTTSASSDVSTGGGNDTINTAAALAGTVNGGSGTDTLNITGAVNLSAATLTSIEIIDINGNAVSIDEAVVNGQGVVIDGTAALTVKNIMTSLDLSSLSFASTASTVVDFTSNNDSTLGQSANLTITGSANADAITTGNGTNSVNGGAGADTITGGTSVDTLIGGAGADTISAGAGNDVVQGDAGADVIYGAAGNDTITGGEDVDAIAGGAGADTINLTETTSVADYLTILALTDGSAAGAAAGTFTGYDVITGFTTGTDKIIFDSIATIDALGTVGTAIAGAKYVVAGTAATTAASDLVAASDFTNVDKVVTFLNDTGAIADATNVGGLGSVVGITFGASTYLYAVDTANAAVIATEVKMLGTVDAVLVAGDLIIV